MTFPTCFMVVFCYLTHWLSSVKLQHAFLKVILLSNSWITNTEHVWMSVVQFNLNQASMHKNNVPFHQIFDSKSFCTWSKMWSQRVIVWDDLHWWKKYERSAEKWWCHTILPAALSNQCQLSWSLHHATPFGILPSTELHSIPVQKLQFFQQF